MSTMSVSDSFRPLPKAAPRSNAVLIVMIMSLTTTLRSVDFPHQTAQATRYAQMAAMSVAPSSASEWLVVRRRAVAHVKMQRVVVAMDSVSSVLPSP